MVTVVNGLHVNYSVQGQGAPILLLHGWRVGGWSFKPVADSLASRFQLVMPDLPGFGGSESPPTDWGVGEYAQFTVSFLSALGVGAVHLLGHSFGGRIAIWIAAHWPERVRKLVLVNSAGIRPKRSLAYAVRVGAAKTLNRLGPWGRRFAPLFGSRDYKTAGPLRGTLVKVVNEDLTGLLDRIQAPTLLVWGDHDRAVPLHDGHLMAGLIKGSRLLVLGGAGHFSYLDRPAEFCDAVRDFLERTC